MGSCKFERAKTYNFKFRNRFRKRFRKVPFRESYGTARSSVKVPPRDSFLALSPKRVRQERKRLLKTKLLTAVSASRKKVTTLFMG